MGDFVKAVRTVVGDAEPVVTWGEVTGTGPLTVRLVGHATDISPADQAAHLTLSTNDRVVLFRVGGKWIVGLEL